MKTRTVTLGDIGDPSAPPGSKAWATWIHTELHCVLAETKGKSDHIKSLVDLMVQHKGYRHLCDGSGRAFKTYEEFCTAPHPYGLGYRPEDIDRVIGERAHAERAAKTLEAARENQEPLNGKAGRPKGNDSKSTKGNHSRGGNNTAYRVQRLRRDAPAIAARLDAGEFKSVAAAERAANGQEPDPPRKTKTPGEWLTHWWAKATSAERRAFRTFIDT